jgi:hypothetical protein
MVKWCVNLNPYAHKAPQTHNSNRFNSDAYLRNPTVYDGVTKKTSRTGKKAKPFVHYFNTSGIMQHNDIGPQWHPTDVGAIKVASHLQQFIRMTFGWDLYATGPE